MGDRDHLTTNGLQWLYVGLALRNTGWLGMSSLLPVFFVAEVGASTVAMGALLALSPVVEIGGMYAFGRVADAVGRKPLVTGGLAGHVVVALLLAGATVPASALVSQLVGAAGMLVKGVAFSALVAGTVAFIGDVTPVDRESELMGLRSTAKGLGGVVGPILVGSIATVASYEAAFVVASGLAAVSAALVRQFLVESHGGVGPTLLSTAGDD